MSTVMSGTILTFPTPRELRALWAIWRQGTVTPGEVAPLYDVADPLRTAYYVLGNLERRGWLVHHEAGWSAALSRSQACAMLTEGTCC